VDLERVGAADAMERTMAKKKSTDNTRGEEPTNRPEERELFTVAAGRDLAQAVHHMVRAKDAVRRLRDAGWNAGLIMDTLLALDEASDSMATVCGAALLPHMPPYSDDENPSFLVGIPS
jgi:hypothetical protein